MKTCKKMNVKTRLREYSKMQSSEAKEEEIKKTVEQSKAAFWEEAEKIPVSHFDFLYQQAGIIRKRWWVLQFLVLTLLWGYIYGFGIRSDIRNVTGVIAGMFGILLIPELWKNRTSWSVEIEGSTYYSLRQIYAARMLAFGVVDVGLLTVFTAITSFTTSMRAEEMIIHFFLPFTVTCGILFTALCSRCLASQAGAFLLALLWIMVWVLIVLNDRVYSKISVSVWMTLLVLAVCYLGYGIRRTLVTCDSFWEESREWN